MTSPLLQIHQLVVGFPDRRLSSPISLNIPSGARLGIIGGNGTGKTTLMKTLMGLLPPIRGQVKWRPGARLGYVPQENQVNMLFPIRVFDLLKMGLFPQLPRLRKTNRRLTEASHEILSEMEIAHLAKSLVRDLSGGERQRALIARAWISKPDVLVMDEPFNSLDHAFKAKLDKIFSAWQARHELAVIMIDHDLNRIINQVDYLIVLGARGTLYGPTREVLTPQNLSETYGAPLHVHEEDGCLQVHFL
jgi:ABC-type Mn/Zn transport systems, ATPase component